MNIKWVFFDVGSTLADETEAFKHCINDAVKGTDVTAEQVLAKSVEFARQNRPGARDAMIFYGLPRVEWHKEDEFPYPDAEEVLRYVHSRGYKIGVIANQLLGTASRLEKWGLLKYISVVAASAELGVAKPDPAIFTYALEQAGCAASEALMVGDRLDNDVIPAKALGMKTAWVRQGLAVYQQVVREDEQPDYTVDCLSGLKEIL